MAWEKRKQSQGRYFTLTRVRQGKRTRLYFGAGEVGELAATWHQLWIWARQRNTLLCQQELQRCLALNRRVVFLHCWIELCFSRLMRAAGFCRRPGWPFLWEVVMSGNTPPKKGRKPASGKSSKSQVYRKRLGNLSIQLEQEWLGPIAGEDHSFASSLRENLADLNRQLGLATADSLECLLIQRVTNVWLECHYWDLLAVQQDNLAAPLRRELERRQRHATNRHGQAVLALGQYRTLPAVRRAP